LNTGVLMQAIVDTLKAWQPHPFVDHFTVALILIGVLTDLVASLISGRLWLRYMALTLMILGALAAAGSSVTGGWEAERVWDSVTGPGKDVLQRHAEFGDYLPWVFGALALWRLGAQFVGFIAASRPIYLLVAIVAAGFILYQGRLGGELVYTYGVGTEMLPSANASPSPSEAATPSVPQAEATPIPTVFVPSPTPTANAPASPTSTSSGVNSPAAAISPIGSVPSSSISPSVSAAPSPSSTASTTPVIPPSGETAPSGEASPAAESTPKNL
jgi:uncharacterized membrane protein